jgi:hypothetical protein
LCIAGIAISGCSLKSEDSSKKNLDFTVCDSTRIPEELQEIIDEKKNKEFKISYINNAYMFIAIGYGEQGKTNHKITVEDLYLAEDGIHVKTMLYSEKATGTDADKTQETGNTLTPYIVIKCEKYDVPVIFETD